MPNLQTRIDRLETTTAAAEYCTCQYATIVIVDHDAPEPAPAADDMCPVCGGKCWTKRISIRAEHDDT